MQILLTGVHQNLYQTIHRVYEYINLDTDVIPSSETVIDNLKLRYDVCDYVWENIESYLKCLARDCSRSFHGLGSDEMSEYFAARDQTIAVLYDSQCQIQSKTK